MADQFCLRWNNFQTNIVSALDSLKCSEDLVDVTLTCEGRNIKAHKVILSACSPYFRNVFKENPCQHPVIILKDVSADDIVSLLSYMYQGEVFIEESKLSSFLHTAALLQVKGLTGVTQQTESFSSPSTTNKLYTQLTISSKPHFTHKETKIPALKKRRSSTSDKPNDVPIGDHKKSKISEACDIYTKNNGPSQDSRSRIDNPVHAPENNIEKNKHEHSTITANGKNSTGIHEKSNGYRFEYGSFLSHGYPRIQIRISGTSLIGKDARDTILEVNIQDDIPVSIKTEWMDDDNSLAPPPICNSENEDSIPDYENSMLARSLISGINPSKSDNCVNPTSLKKTSIPDLHNTRPKEANIDPVTFTNTLSKSPIKSSPVEESLVKTEKQSPKSDIEYEPEVLLSEHQDGTDSDSTYSQEQSQALMLLAGMSNVPVIAPGTSATQAVPTHQQSNHAAICGDCPHCGMKYSNQSALKYHVRLMHSDLTNRLCCYLCPRSFTMRETFKEHMWSSHGQRN